MCLSQSERIVVALIACSHLWNQKLLAQPGCCPETPTLIQLSAPWPGIPRNSLPGAGRDDFRFVAGGSGSFHCTGAHTGRSSCAVDFNRVRAVGNADEGTPILAVADGKVGRTGFDSELGYHVILEHNDLKPGLTSLYAHLRDDPTKNPGLRVGDNVRRGVVIGFLGTTGKSTSAHLHFELRQDNQSINFGQLDGQQVFDRAEIVSYNGIFAAPNAVHPDGTLLKPADPSSQSFDTIYYIEGGVLRPFPSEYHYRSWRLDGSYLFVLITNSELQRYEIGKAMTFRPGSLLRSTTPGKTSVYVVDGAVAHLRPLTEQEFVEGGYQETLIMYVPDKWLEEAPGQGILTGLWKGVFQATDAAPKKLFFGCQQWIGTSTNLEMRIVQSGNTITGSLRYEGSVCDVGIEGTFDGTTFRFRDIGLIGEERARCSECDGCKGGKPGADVVTLVVKGNTMSGSSPPLAEQCPLLEDDGCCHLSGNYSLEKSTMP